MPNRNMKHKGTVTGSFTHSLPHSATGQQLVKELESQGLLPLPPMPAAPASGKIKLHPKGLKKVQSVLAGFGVDFAAAVGDYTCMVEPVTEAPVPSTSFVVQAMAAQVDDGIKKEVARASLRALKHILGDARFEQQVYWDAFWQVRDEKYGDWKK